MTDSVWIAKSKLLLGVTWQLNGQSNLEDIIWDVRHPLCFPGGLGIVLYLVSVSTAHPLPSFCFSFSPSELSFSKHSISGMCPMAHRLNGQSTFWGALETAAPVGDNLWQALCYSSAAGVTQGQQEAAAAAGLCREDDNSRRSTWSQQHFVQEENRISNINNILTTQVSAQLTPDFDSILSRLSWEP